MRQSLTLLVAGLPLYQRTGRARRPQARKEERSLHERRGESWGERDEWRGLCGQDAEGVCEYLECCEGRVSVSSALYEG
jgi:hypothetical protein